MIQKHGEHLLTPHNRPSVRERRAGRRSLNPKAQSKPRDPFLRIRDRFASRRSTFGAASSVPIPRFLIARPTHARTHNGALWNLAGAEIVLSFRLFVFTIRVNHGEAGEDIPTDKAY